MEEQDKFKEVNYKKGRIISGIILIIAGSLFFAKKLGILFPEWLFTWPMFLIALGFYIGGKHNFRTPGWLIMVGIGFLFLLEEFYPGMNLAEYFWPIVLIAAGAFIIVKPHRRKRNWEGFDRFGSNQDDPRCMRVSETNENQIEIVAVMGGVKKSVFSKDFKGGEINCVMGGAEVNLIQADINGTAVLEINNILGGTKLVVPANWEVISDAMVVLGGIEDKRPMPNDSQRSNDKTLIIKGSCIMGGIDIRSY